MVMRGGLSGCRWVGPRAVCSDDLQRMRTPRRSELLKGKGRRIARRRLLRSGDADAVGVDAEVWV